MKAKSHVRTSSFSRKKARYEGNSESESNAKSDVNSNTKYNFDTSEAEMKEMVVMVVKASKK